MIHRCFARFHYTKLCMPVCLRGPSVDALSATRMRHLSATFTLMLQPDYIKPEIHERSLKCVPPVTPTQIFSYVTKFLTWCPATLKPIMGRPSCLGQNGLLIVSIVIPKKAMCMKCRIRMTDVHQSMKPHWCKRALQLTATPMQILNLQNFMFMLHGPAKHFLLNSGWGYFSF